MQAPRGALCIIWVLGMCRQERFRFSRFWYKNGPFFTILVYKERCLFLRFGCFGIRNGLDFHDFGQGTVSICTIFMFEEWKIGIRLGIHFSKNWYKVGYVVDVWAARP